MGGENPYIKSPEVKMPKKTYKVFVENSDKIIEVNPSSLPYGDTGLSGSILDIALNHDIDMDHACGGVCACATCHVYIKKGMESCSKASEDELDMLDNAPDLKPNSRLACQCVPNGDEDIIVEIPSWNRNLVREGN